MTKTWIIFISKRNALRKCLRTFKRNGKSKSMFISGIVQRPFAFQKKCIIPFALAYQCMGSILLLLSNLKMKFLLNKLSHCIVNQFMLNAFLKDNRLV